METVPLYKVKSTCSRSSIQSTSPASAAGVERQALIEMGFGIRGFMEGSSNGSGPPETDPKLQQLIYICGVSTPKMITFSSACFEPQKRHQTCSDSFIGHQDLQVGCRAYLEAHRGLGFRV